MYFKLCLPFLRADQGVDALLGGCPALTKLKLNTHTIFHGGGLSFVKLNQESVDTLIARGLDVADITTGLMMPRSNVMRQA